MTDRQQHRKIKPGCTVHDSKDKKGGTRQEGQDNRMRHQELNRNTRQPGEKIKEEIKIVGTIHQRQESKVFYLRVRQQGQDNRNRRQVSMDRTVKTTSTDYCRQKIYKS
jgi:hypothetical protein